MGWLGPQKSEEQIKRAMIRQYFEPERGLPPWVYAALGGLSVAAMIAFVVFAVSFYATVIAAIMAVILFAIAWVMFNDRTGRADDVDIDVWRDEDFDRLVADISKDAALNAADLIDPSHPIVIAGLPRFDHLQVRRNHDEAPHAWRFKVKVGEDGITRFTPPCLTVLHFTKDHLIAYQCDLDLLSGKALNQTIEEYFWQDIVSLQIEKRVMPPAEDEFALMQQWSKSLPGALAEKYEPLFSDESEVLPTGKRTILRLKTNTGSGLEIVVEDERFADNPDEDSLQIRNEKAIARLRKLLRDRKARR
jgi:uncharacterized membrane protein